MKKLGMVIVFLVASLSLTACVQTDVVGKVAKTSFEKVLEAVPNQVEEGQENWSLIAPDRSARFIWSTKYDNKATQDIEIMFDLEPFIEAGLNVSDLKMDIVREDKIVLGTNLGDDSIKYSGEVTPITSFNKIVELHRSKIGYHEKLDHYGVDLGNGNKFEWAKDINTNDKDIVFVVDPRPFIEAGLNPDAVKGWTYALVEMKDESGKAIEEYKLLKAFDIQ